METVNVSSVDNVFNLHFEKNPFLVFDDDIVCENLNPRHKQNIRRPVLMIKLLAETILIRSKMRANFHGIYNAIVVPKYTNFP